MRSSTVPEPDVGEFGLRSCRIPDHGLHTPDGHRASEAVELRTEASLALTMIAAGRTTLGL